MSTMTHTIDLQEPINALSNGFEPMGGDNDYRSYERHLSGRMTKARYKALSGYCRRNTRHFNCGCEHDCCGCLCSQTVTISQKRNCVIISLYQGYNY